MKTKWIKVLGALLVTFGTLAFGTALPAQESVENEQWWENSPYYNEDEAYDPTDWFDGNNYEYDYSGYYDDYDDNDDWYYDYYDAYDYGL